MPPRPLWYKQKKKNSTLTKNTLPSSQTAEGSEQVGSAGGSSGPEHPNPAIDRLIGVIRMAGGDPSLTDVEGVVQELTGLYPE